MSRDSSLPLLIRSRVARFLLLVMLPFAQAHAAQTASESFNPSPNAIDIPAWFQETFLDFREDVREAAKQGKRVMIYFGQDGCPYCRELMRVNFSQKDIVDQARGHFVAVAGNYPDTKFRVGAFNT